MGDESTRGDAEDWRILKDALVKTDARDADRLIAQLAQEIDRYAATRPADPPVFLSVVTHTTPPQISVDTFHCVEPVTGKGWATAVRRLSAALSIWSAEHAGDDARPQ